ncbi:MAG: hypothetical protein LBH67_02420 [Rickettsia sp.]|nr:hypothetical protein [Rickettsia sp.]MDR0296812.1 hypothetical protein [Rickettsia sp.]
MHGDWQHKGRVTDF